MADADFEFENPDYDGGETKGHDPAVKKDLVPAGQPGVPVMEILQKGAKNILPAVIMIVDGLETVYTLSEPYINKAIDLYNQAVKLVEPYGAQEVGQCLTGIFMIFLGGSLATLTAVYEAVHQGGYEDLSDRVSLLFREFKKFKAANKTDDELDEDGDGIADVKQISNQQFITRKTLLFLKATDPENINKALQSLYTVFIAVMATLRLRFARAISLGASIGDQLTDIFKKYAAEPIKSQIEEDYKKWVIPTGRYVCRFIGITIAFRIQRILTTFHTAFKGARVLTKGLTNLAERNGYGYLTDGWLDEALSFGLMIVGIVVQLFMWSEVPVIFKLLLFPVFFVEGLLSMFVSIGLSFSTSTGKAS